MIIGNLGGIFRNRYVSKYTVNYVFLSAIQKLQIRQEAKNMNVIAFLKML